MNDVFLSALHSQLMDAAHPARELPAQAQRLRLALEEGGLSVDFCPDLPDPCEVSRRISRCSMFVAVVDDAWRLSSAKLGEMLQAMGQVTADHSGVAQPPIPVRLLWCHERPKPFDVHPSWGNSAWLDDDVQRAGQQVLDEISGSRRDDPTDEDDLL